MVFGGQNYVEAITNMAKIIINNFTEGLTPYFWQGVQYAKLGTNGMYAGGNTNPMLFLGSLNPALNDWRAIGSSSQISGNLRAWEMTENSTDNFPIFYTGAGAKLSRCIFNIIGNFEENSGGYSRTIIPHSGHFGVKFQDVKVYKINESPRIAYAWTDNVDGDVGMATISTYQNIATFNDYALSTSTSGTVLTTGGDRRVILEVADNGFLYIAHNNIIHKFDGTRVGGTNGTATMNLIDLKTPNNIVDMRDGLGKMWIASVSSLNAPASETNWGFALERLCEIRIWDRVSRYSFIDIIPINAASICSLFFHNGIPHCFTIGYSGIVELRQWNGRTFQIIKEVGDNTYEPGNRNSVVSTGNGIVWLTKRGRMMYWGKIGREFNDGLYQIGQTPSTATNSGAIIRVGEPGYPESMGFLTSWNVGATHYYQTFAGDIGNRRASQGDWYSKVYELPKRSHLKGIDIYWKPVTNNNNDKKLNIKVYTNQSTTHDGNTLQLDYKNDGMKGFYHFPFVKNNVDAVQIEVEWDTSQTIDYSILPSRIEIEYEPTEKIQ